MEKVKYFLERKKAKLKEKMLPWHCSWADWVIEILPWIKFSLGSEIGFRFFSLWTEMQIHSNQLQLYNTLCVCVCVMCVESRMTKCGDCLRPELAMY